MDYTDLLIINDQKLSKLYTAMTFRAAAINYVGVATYSNPTPPSPYIDIKQGNRQPHSTVIIG